MATQEQVSAYIDAVMAAGVQPEEMAGLLAAVVKSGMTTEQLGAFLQRGGLQVQRVMLQSQVDGLRGKQAAAAADIEAQVQAVQAAITEIDKQLAAIALG